MTITFENVQNVSIRQGLLQRHFGISNLVYIYDTSDTPLQHHDLESTK